MKLKNLLTKLLVLAVVLATIFSLSTVFAIDVTVEEEAAIEEEVMVAEAEEFAWYYRTFMGEKQKRCWSVTYGYWVTEWTTIVL